MWELTIKRHYEKSGFNMTDEIQCKNDNLDGLILVIETFEKYSKGNYEYNIVKLENEVE